MTRKAVHLFASALLAAGSIVACAGDGVDNGNDGSGNTTGNNTGNTTGNNTGNNNNNNPGSGGSSTSNPGSGGSNTSNPGSGGSNTPAAGDALNTVGGYHKAGPLQGYFWTAADMSGSNVLPKDYAVNGKICAKGSAAKVEGEAYSMTWGVLLGYNVSQAETPPNAPVAKALNGTITIGISGTLPDGARLKLEVSGTDYCAPLTSGMNTVALSSLKKECWLSGGDAYAGQPVTSVAVQVTTNANTATPFDFCISSLSYSE